LNTIEFDIWLNVDKSLKYHTQRAGTGKVPLTKMPMRNAPTRSISISAAVVQNSTAETQSVRHLCAAGGSAGKAQEAFMLLDPANLDALIPDTHRPISLLADL